MRNFRQKISRVRSPPAAEQASSIKEWMLLGVDDRRRKIAAIMSTIDFERLEGLHKGKFASKEPISLPLPEQRALHQKMRSAILSATCESKRNRLIQRAKERCSKEVFLLDEVYFNFLQWLYNYEQARDKKTEAA